MARFGKLNQPLTGSIPPRACRYLNISNSSLVIAAGAVIASTNRQSTDTVSRTDFCKSIAPSPPFVGWLRTLQTSWAFCFSSKTWDPSGLKQQNSTTQQKGSLIIHGQGA